MEEIAAYKSDSFYGRHRFILFKDTIRVVGKTFFRSEEDVTFPLLVLQPRCDKVRVRLRHFWLGLFMAFIGIFGYMVLFMKLNYEPDGFFSVLLAMIGLTGIFMAIITSRLIEFAQFSNDSGVPLFMIARTHRWDTEFDTFNATLINQIRTVKGIA